MPTKVDFAGCCVTCGALDNEPSQWVVFTYCTACIEAMMPAGVKVVKAEELTKELLDEIRQTDQTPEQRG